MKVKISQIIINDYEKEDVQAKWFALAKNPEYRFKIKPISQNDLRLARSKYTSIIFDKKTHQKIEVEDPEKKREVTENLIFDSVLDWEGVKEITETGESVKSEFSKEKFKKLYNKVGNWKLDVEFNDVEGENEAVTFSGWFAKIALDPENFSCDDTENL